MSPKLLIGLSVWLALTSTAVAQPFIEDPKWLRKPSGNDLARVFPQAAQKARLNGRAVMTCTVDPKGGMTDCTLIEEDPAGYGYGQATLRLAEKFGMAVTSLSGKSTVGGRVRIPVIYRGPGLTTKSADGGSVRETEWKRKPSASDLRAVWPVAALKKGVGGKATIACQVSLVGLLENCVVDSEDPAGVGFGAAALLLANSFEMSPKLQNGEPVRARVRIPIVFRSPGGPVPLADGGAMRMLHKPLWDMAPTAAQVAAAWPQKAPAALDSARVVLRCKLKPDGGLRDCTHVSVEPDGAGFLNAAHSLVPLFKVRIGTADPALLKKAGVTLPFQFLNPKLASGPRMLSNAQWARSADFNQVIAVYPPAAIDKGVRSGVGVAECVVAEGGSLTACKAASETPADLGFGQAAISIASVMQLNVWGEDGLPPDGATIRLPVRLHYNEGEPATAVKPADQP